MTYDAVRLFVDRASASWAPFEVNTANQAALAELLRRLDGVPLAIELASVRVRSLSVQQILDRLADRFALLTRGSRSALPRQQTLRALIDWSYDLLSPAERMLWARATVFSGGFDLEAVRAVVCDEAVPSAEAGSLLDALAAKSILVRDGVGPMARFRMLESIREYGVAQLEASGTADGFRERHRCFFRDLAATASIEMYGPAEVDWYLRLRREHDNLRAALDLTVRTPGRVDEGLMMLGHLQHYWVMVSRFAEGRLWADRLLERAPDASVARAAAWEVAGRLAVLQGDVERGRPLLTRALDEATALDDGTWRAEALHGLALATMFWGGDPVEALPLLEEALALHEVGTDPFGVPLALVQLATLQATLGDQDRALEYAELCIARSEAAGEQWCAALARWTQALVVWRAGRRSKVKTYAREVLRLKQPFGDRLGMAMSMEMLAWAAADEGRHDHAAVLMGAVAAALESVGGSLFNHLLADHDACVEQTRAELGEESYARSFREGADLSFDEAVSLALGRRRPEGADGDGTAAPAAADRLSKRETEIAGLVADGLTNREIAERLFMSQRTAEGHVARILRKLGFTTREQIKAWVAEYQRPV
jgi:non-specific serine/threonine protein kinase